MEDSAGVVLEGVFSAAAGAGLAEAARRGGGKDEYQTHCDASTGDTLAG